MPAKVGAEPAPGGVVRTEMAHTDDPNEATGAPLYRFFDSHDECVQALSECHQAATHIILHPAVPLLYKLRYFSMSLGIVVLQSVSILALLAAVDQMGTTDILGEFRSMHILDWFMHITLCFLIGFTVHTELEQSKICDIQIVQACHSDDPAISACAKWWSAPLMIIQKMRQLVLVPFTVATGPILALEGGLDAESVALNVLAILFIFELDDGAFTSLFSRAQRQYLEAVEVSLSSHEQGHLAWLILGVAVCSFGSSLFPIILFDPNAIYGGAAVDAKFAGWFQNDSGAHGEPVSSLTLLSTGLFSSLMIIEVLYGYLRGGSAYRNSKTNKVLAAMNILMAIGIIAVSVLLGQLMGSMIGDIAQETTTTNAAATTDAATGSPPA